MVKFFTAEALAGHAPETSESNDLGVHRARVSSFRDAAHLVAALPYGRGSKRSDHLMVLFENKGTCSTKHGLLALLAQEQNLPIALYLGIYEMNGLNTPGVGPVLETNCLTAIPEAHSYLKYGSQ